VEWGTSGNCASGRYEETYGYSTSGLVTSKGLKLFGAGKVDLSYSYSNEGQVTVLDQSVNGYQQTAAATSYDSMGRPVAANGPGNVWTVSNVTYNAADQLLTVTHGGVQETRQYNERMQLTRITVPGQVDLEYRYSATQNDGNITSMKNYINGEEVNYGYDSLNRLTSAVTTGPEWGLSFVYDGFGNKTGQTVTKGTAPGLSLGVDANNRVVGASYDAAGNTTSVNGVTATWDAQGRMLTASGDTYSYNPSNQRVYRNGRLFVRGLDGKVVGIYSTSGGLALVNTYAYFRGRKVGQKEDRLGTVQNGSRFYPYGEESPATGQDKDKFATYWRDGNTGFDYAMNRYYMSAHGRFLSPDPYPGSATAARSGSWNRYGYTEGNPVDRNDPTGLFMNFKDMEAADEAYNREVDRTQGPGGGDHGLAFGSDTGAFVPQSPNAILEFGTAISPTGQTGLPVYTVASKAAYGSALELVASGVVSASSCITSPGCWSQIVGASILAGTGLGAATYYGAFGTGALTTLAGTGTVASLAGVSPNVTFTHFTNAQGLQGITGLNPASLVPGQTTTVSQLQFGFGQNSYLARNPGDIFVTTLPPNASSVQLSQIGVYIENQGFAISFTGEAAAAQGILPMGSGIPGIYTIPGGSIMTGCFTVYCRP